VTAPLPLSAVLASVGDPSRTRAVYATIMLLVALGLAMVLVAAWLVRRTRVDPPVLAPLERMGDRAWRTAPDPAWQRRVLDELRPPGAEPLDEAPLVPAQDADFELGPQQTGVEGLAGDAADAGLPPPSAAEPDPEPAPADVVADPEPELEPVPEPEGEPTAAEPEHEPDPEPEPEATSEDAAADEEALSDDVDPGPVEDGSVASGHGLAGPGRDDRPLP
jgi:hypothetical protein